MLEESIWWMPSTHCPIPLIFHGISHVEYTVSKLCDAGISTPDFCPDSAFAPDNSAEMLLCEQVDTNTICV